MEVRFTFIITQMFLFTGHSCTYAGVGKDKTQTKKIHTIFLKVGVPPKGRRHRNY